MKTGEPILLTSRYLALVYDDKTHFREPHTLLRVSRIYQKNWDHLYFRNELRMFTDRSESDFLWLFPTYSCACLPDPSLSWADKH